MTKTSLTAILDDAIKGIDDGRYTDLAVNMMIVAFGHLSDLAKSGATIEIDAVDTYAYCGKVSDRRKVLDAQKMARERASKRFLTKAKAHRPFSPHHDYWSYKAQEALTCH